MFMDTINKFKNTQTELHTHLMGMLSTQSFLLLLEEFGCRIFIDNGMIVPANSVSKSYTIEEIMNDKYLYDIVLRSISVPSGKQVPYSNLGKMYDTRNLLLKECINQILSKNPDIEDQRITKLVYNTYYNLSLQELVDNGVTYTEISFSNPSIISSLTMNSKLKDKIDVRFLLSSQRSNSVKRFRNTKNNLERQLNKYLINEDDPNSHASYSYEIPNEAVIGFDLMGEETPISTNINSESFKELEHVLEMILITLNKYNGSVFRIHSGETPLCTRNTKIILSLLEGIKNTNKLIIPPPYFRIGHGIHIQKDNEYLRLLKEFDCEIEINASSNFALSNIRDFSEIDYEFYTKNGVPVFISTDGHGMYNTTTKKEDEIALSRMDIKQYLELFLSEERYIGK